MREEYLYKKIQSETRRKKDGKKIAGGEKKEGQTASLFVYLLHFKRGGGEGTVIKI